MTLFPNHTGRNRSGKHHMNIQTFRKPERMKHIGSKIDGEYVVPTQMTDPFSFSFYFTNITLEWGDTMDIIGQGKNRTEQYCKNFLL